MNICEVLLKSGWKKVEGPNAMGDFHNDGTSFVFIMRHPKSDKYIARIESAKVADFSYMTAGNTLDEVLYACLESDHL